MHTARDIIIALNECGLSDTAISNAVGCSREAIYRIRGRKGHYSGRNLLPRLESLAHACSIVAAKPAPPRQPAPQTAPAPRAPMAPPRQPPATHRPPTLADHLLRIAAQQEALRKQKAAMSSPQVPAMPPAQKPMAPRPAPTAQSAPRQPIRRRCMQCPFQPPIGLSPADFAAWLQQHPCDRQQHNRCPS